MGKTIFVSHASKDKTFVDGTLVPLLEELDVKPWCANRKIMPARQWESEIRTHLNGCDWFLVVISADSLESDWVKAEVHWATELRPARIIPVTLDSTEPGDCHLKMKLIQHIDWNDGIETVRAKLRSVLKPAADQPLLVDAQSADDESIKLVQRLREIRDTRNTDDMPFVFQCLTHDDKGVCGRAMKIVRQIGWDDIEPLISGVVKRGDRDDIQRLLNGLSAIEATDDTVAALQMMSELIDGDIRIRALDLTERKRLGLQLDNLAKLFSDFHQPFELKNALGCGLFTASYLGRNKMSGDKLVVRVLKPDLVLRDDIRILFMELLNRSIKYTHGSLARTNFVNQFPKDNIYFCVRDYIDGVSLQKILDTGRRFDLHKVIEILRVMTSALAPIHTAGELHGGVKPSNIFLDDDNRVILGDPSLPIYLVPPSVDRLAYDYRYTAPESFQPSQLQSPAADYYSLGCVAYELLCGQPPFSSDNPFRLAGLHRDKEVAPPSRINQSLSKEVDDTLMKFLEKEEKNRPANVEDIFRMLDDLDPERVGSRRHQIASTTILERDAREGIPDDMTRFEMLPSNDMGVDVVPAEPRGPGAIDPQTGTGWREPAEIQDRFFPMGHVIRERFVIEEVIGEGGMGVVYKARDLRKEEAQDRAPHVAIKVLNEDFMRHPQSVIALQREAKKSQKLAHPNILNVYDFDRDQDCVYMTMELLDGEELGKMLKRYQSSPMPADNVLQIVEGMSNALSHAHGSGIIHSDFKPSNVFVDKNNVATVLDFGIARVVKQREVLDDVNTVIDISTLGALTPAYASLEMIEGFEPPDPRDDIYALACITYQMLSGSHPFERIQADQACKAGIKPKRIENLNRSQWRGLLHGLEFKRDKRTASAHQFLADVLAKPSLVSRFFKS